MYLAQSTPTLLAATDLVSGSHSLYTIGVSVLVVLILLAGGARAAGVLLRRAHRRKPWAGRITAVIVAVSSARLRHLRLDETHRRPHRHHHRPIRPITPTSGPLPLSPPLRCAGTTGGRDGAPDRALFGKEVSVTESAQLFKGVHDIPVYTDILFKKPLRLWVAVSLYGGTAITVVATILALDSGHARSVLICGLLATAAAAGAAALIPRGPPYPAIPATPAPGAPCARLLPAATDPLAGAAANQSSATSASPRTASTPTTSSADCPTICNPPNAASASPTDIKPLPVKYPPAHGHSGCRCRKTNASCFAPCCTATATNPNGSPPAASWRPSSPNKTPAPASTGWRCPSTPAAPGAAPSDKSTNCATG